MQMADNAPDAATCTRHEGIPVDGKCSHCDGPMCRECRKENGYFCSPECAEASRSAVSAAELEERAHAEKEFAKARKMSRWIGIAVGLMVLAVVLFFVWRFVLFPVGKICWIWMPGEGGDKMALIGRDGTDVLASTGAHLHWLNPCDGKLVRSSELKGADTMGQIQIGVDGLAVRTDDVFRLIARDGTEVCTFKAEGPLIEWLPDEEAGRAFALIGPDPDIWTAYFKKLEQLEKTGSKEKVPEPEQKSTLVCVDTREGKEQWRKALKSGVSISEMDCDRKGTLYAVYGMRGKGWDMTYLLCAQDAATGKRLWSAQLPEAPEWGPVCCEGMMLMTLEGELQAYSAKGEEIWAVKINEDISPYVREGILLLENANQTVCLDPATGKARWSVPYTFAMYSGFRVVGDRVVALADIPEASMSDQEQVQLPPAYDQAEDILKDFGLDAASLKQKKTVPALVSLDLSSGKELWRTPKVRGEVLVDDARIVVVADTAMTSMIQVVAGGRGAFIIQQYDPLSGKKLYSKQHDISVRNPVLSGNRLVCRAYERQEQVGILQMATGAAQPEVSAKSLGIVAFRLR